MKQPRCAGVLLHMSSMPSPYGVGVFGAECLSFLDKLEAMGFRRWQVLPFTITDDANSPYCAPSAFAGNYLFIDPRKLAAAGLLNAEEAAANECPSSPYTADYPFARERRMSCLKTAYSRLTSELKTQIEAFSETQDWLEDFALFMAVKTAEEGKPWWEWKPEHRAYLQCKKTAGSYQEEINFWKFTQFIFYKQWNEIKQYAAQKGIGIIGDMPIYVARDSADVWSRPDLFRLDPVSLCPTAVAGVPPDYFAKDGQLWGNPLYDWKAMEQDGYRWWISRLRHTLGIYDTVRIDHFRAFASYWAVPADAETAKNGQWEKGPGLALFDALEQALGKADILAEDLGLFGEDVAALLEQTGFPGMKVIQFGFDPAGDSSHLPHNYPFHCVAYAGTHDNNTLLGWLWDATEDERQFAMDYCGFCGDHWGDGGFHSASCRAITETLWRSSANTVIIALQDLCGFGKDARMNIPGVPELNWRYRTTEETLAQIDTAYYQKINRLYRRGTPTK